MCESVTIRLRITKTEARKMTRIARWEKESERVNILLRPRLPEGKNIDDKI